MADSRADRLTFLLALNEILFSPELKDAVRERDHLHQILLNELWIFGEQYTLGTDDESLKSLLTEHLRILGRVQLAPTTSVTDILGKNSRPDLMLYRCYPQPSHGFFEHLVVELKRPNCVLGQDELSQIEKYAFTVADDQRFDKGKTRWTFLLLGTDLDAFAKRKCGETGKEFGHIYESEFVNVRVKTWAQLLQETKWRHEFYREKLSYQATTPEAIAYLKEKYAKYIPRNTEGEGM